MPVFPAIGRPTPHSRCSSAQALAAAGLIFTSIAGCSGAREPSAANAQAGPGGEKKRPGAVAVRLAENPIADRSPETQSKRRAFVDNQLAGGLFERFVAEPAPAKLWVTPKFLLMNRDSQAGYVKCVYELAYDGKRPEDFVALYEASTNSEIGRYSPAKGIEPR